jgi:hypothetical protein
MIETLPSATQNIPGSWKRISPLLSIALMDTRGWIVPLIDPVPLIEPSANARPLPGAPAAFWYSWNRHLTAGWK